MLTLHVWVLNVLVFFNLIFPVATLINGGHVRSTGLVQMVWQMFCRLCKYIVYRVFFVGHVGTL